MHLAGSRQLFSFCRSRDSIFKLCSCEVHGNPKRQKKMVART
jgi:hypothetical protein